MDELEIVLASYRDMFGVKTDRANEIHRLACEEVARLRAVEQLRALDTLCCEEEGCKEPAVMSYCETHAP